MKRYFYGVSIVLLGLLLGCQSVDTRPVTAPAGSESFATMTLIFDG